MWSYSIMTCYKFFNSLKIHSLYNQEKWHFVSNLTLSTYTDTSQQSDCAPSMRTRCLNCSSKTLIIVVSSQQSSAITTLSRASSRPLVARYINIAKLLQSHLAWGFAGLVHGGGCKEGTGVVDQSTHISNIHLQKNANYLPARQLFLWRSCVEQPIPCCCTWHEWVLF
jgi:hypothetical protein